MSETPVIDFTKAYVERSDDRLAQVDRENSLRMLRIASPAIQSAQAALLRGESAEQVFGALAMAIAHLLAQLPPEDAERLLPALSAHIARFHARLRLVREQPSAS